MSAVMSSCWSFKVICLWWFLRLLNVVLESLTVVFRVVCDFSWLVQFSSVQFSCSAVSDTLWPHEMQHARPPCPSPTPRLYPNSCPLSWGCHLTISSSVVPFSSCLQSFPASGSFQMSQLFPIRWPKDWRFSFSISPYNEHPGLISFRMDWLDLLAVQETQESSPTP